MDSKCEAITILNQEVDRLKMDKDNLKGIIEDLKARSLSSCSPAEREIFSNDLSKTSKTEIELLRQKLRDALGDIQVSGSTIH